MIWDFRVVLVPSLLFQESFPRARISTRRRPGSTTRIFFFYNTPYEVLYGYTLITIVILYITSFFYIYTLGRFY
jgi:hypothetical protein